MPTIQRSHSHDSSRQTGSDAQALVAFIYTAHLERGFVQRDIASTEEETMSSATDKLAAAVAHCMACYDDRDNDMAFRDGMYECAEMLRPILAELQRAEIVGYPTPALPYERPAKWCCGGNVNQTGHAETCQYHDWKPSNAPPAQGRLTEEQLAQFVEGLCSHGKLNAAAVRALLSAPTPAEPEKEMK
jgi:hypothetical protein